MSSPPLLLLSAPGCMKQGTPETLPASDPLFLRSSPHTLRQEQTPLGLPAALSYSPTPRHCGNPATWSSGAIVSTTVHANFHVTLQFTHLFNVPKP